MAREQVKVADAHVDVVKARALSTLDRPQSQKPDVSVFEGRERSAQAEENVARTRSEAAEKEVKVALANVQEAEPKR